MSFLGLNVYSCELSQQLLLRIACTQSFQSDWWRGRNAHVFHPISRFCGSRMIWSQTSHFVNIQVPTCPDPPRRRRSHHALPFIASNERIKGNDVTSLKSAFRWYELSLLFVEQFHLQAYVFVITHNGKTQTEIFSWRDEQLYYTTWRHCEAKLDWNELRR